MLKFILMLSAAAPAAIGQTATATIQGVALDAKTLKPVSAAWVIATRAGAPPLAKHTKSGGDGAFQISGLTSGSYSICVQAAGDTRRESGCIPHQVAAIDEWANALHRERGTKWGLEPLCRLLPIRLRLCFHPRKPPSERVA